MLRKFVYLSIGVIFMTLFIIGPFGIGPALAEDVSDQLPGVVEGVGVHFEVTDSEYLNVTLDSTELVTATVSSVPSVIELRLEAADGALATDLSLVGLVPDLAYHLFIDSLENHFIMTAGADGSLAWTQDLVDPHLIFIQTVPSTYFISDTTDGQDCTAIGTWDEAAKTCTLTTNVSDTIQISSSGITLDGAGHTLSGTSELTSGVLVPGGKRFATTDVTIKNLTIQGFANGVYLHNVQDSKVRGNTILNVTNKGITLDPQNWKYGGNNIVTGNQILGAYYGIYNQGNPNAFQRNTVRDTMFALDGNMLGFFYNNNLINNHRLAHSLQGQTLFADLPFGGNYWSSYDSPLDGCEDLNLNGFCDAAYEPLAHNGNEIGTDSYPWTEVDGWLDIEIGVDNDLIMWDEDQGSVTVTASAHFKDVDTSTTHTALEWDWGDGNTSPALVSSEANGEGDVASASHTYLNTGVYEIKLKMKDAPYLATFEESYQYVVVYDPSAGFVTGGGWIYSPMGAYVPDPEMVGQATFGFVSKFYRTRTGENSLEGNTVFEFHTADFRFTSISYEWLVVNGDKAIYRGLGYIDGNPDIFTDEAKVYGFMLTAQDLVDENGEDADRFRIQIWDGDQATGMIYDNKIGASSNDMTVGTVIGDGSIIVQASPNQNPRK